MSSSIPVEVVFALPDKQRIVKLQVPVGTTAFDPRVKVTSSISISGDTTRNRGALARRACASRMVRPGAWSARALTGSRASTKPAIANRTMARRKASCTCAARP